MVSKRKLTFTLSTLLLMVVIVAQFMSQMVMMRELSAARDELEEVRRKFGYIDAKNAKQIYVARIEENENDVAAYRIHIPPGHHYLLHLTDTIFETEGYPDNPKPTKTLSMNSWKEGADVVLSYSIYHENSAPRVRVWTETEELFNYRPKNWVKTPGPSEGSDLTTHPQKAFDSNETIRFMQWKDGGTKRGVMLWMEPVADYEARLATE